MNVILVKEHISQTRPKNTKTIISDLLYVVCDYLYNTKIEDAKSREISINVQRSIRHTVFSIHINKIMREIALLLYHMEIVLEELQYQEECEAYDHILQKFEKFLTLQNCSITNEILHKSVEKIRPKISQKQTVLPIKPHQLQRNVFSIPYETPTRQLSQSSV